MSECKLCLSEQVCRYNDGYNLYCKEDYECPHFNAADVVSLGAYKQVLWERDHAMEQLKEHGIPFGGAADVVEVVRCKNCIHWGGVTFGNICRRWSAPLAGMKNCTQPDDFCSCGEGKDGAE